MKNETLIKIVKVLKQVQSRKLDLQKARWQIETAMREDERYNGYCNYETWNLNLILTNTESLMKHIASYVRMKQRDFLKDGVRKEYLAYRIGDSLKEDLQGHYYIQEYGIIRIDCESWTNRDFQEINFSDIAKYFMVYNADCDKYESEK